MGEYLNKHLHNIGVVENLTCRGCYEDEKDFQHVLGEYVALGCTRLRYLGTEMLKR